MRKFLSIAVVLLMLCSFASLFSFSSAAAGPEIWDGKRASKFAGGSGTKEDPWQISNGKELAYMQYLFSSTVLKDWLPYEETYGGDYFVLTNDIYMNDVSNFDNWGLKDKAPANKWTKAIGKGGYALQSGTLDGQGHTIYGLYQVSTDFGGGFIHVHGDLDSGQHGTVKNLNLKKCLMYFSERSGMIGGCGFGGTISNCHVSGKIVCYQKDGRSIGGIIGELTAGGVVENCTFRGSIEGDARIVGGIVGSTGNGGDGLDANCIIRNCINYGNIKSSITEVGGICGTLGNARAVSTLENCLNLGNVEGSTAVGGLVGVIGINLKEDQESDGRKPAVTLQNSITAGKVIANGPPPSEDGKPVDKTIFEQSGGSAIGTAAKPDDVKLTVVNCYYDSTVSSLRSIGNNQYGDALANGIKGLQSTAMSGKNAVSTMKLNSSVWLGIDEYYPVIKVLHEGKHTIIGKIGATVTTTNGGGITTTVKGGSAVTTGGNAITDTKPSSGGSDTSNNEEQPSVTPGDTSDPDNSSALPDEDNAGSDATQPNKDTGTDTGDTGTDAGDTGTDAGEKLGANLTWLWIVIGVVVVLGGAGVYSLVFRRTKK